MSWYTIFKVFIEIQMFYLNSKVYILMKNNMKWHISDWQLSAVPLKANHADAEITTIHIPLLCCCATSFYSICFSIIKYCGYWNSQTLDRITDHANKFYKEKLNGNNHPLTINNFPRTLQIYDADINIAFNLEKQGKLLLQKLITDNTKDNTGFLMWISNYCFRCIFQYNNMKTKAKSVKYFIIRFSPNDTLDIFEKKKWHRYSYSVIGGYCKKVIPG